MTITKEQAERAEELVRELQRELDAAYDGTSTLPADHSAKVAVKNADNWLMKPWS